VRDGGDSASTFGIIRRLDFLAALQCMPSDADETQRLSAAKRLGFSGKEVAAIFGKSEAAATKALQRIKNA